MVREGDLTLDGEHKIRDDILKNCARETYIILLTRLPQ